LSQLPPDPLTQLEMCVRHRNIIVMASFAFRSHHRVLFTLGKKKGSNFDAYGHCDQSERFDTESNCRCQIHQSRKAPHRFDDLTFGGNSLRPSIFRIRRIDDHFFHHKQGEAATIGHTVNSDSSETWEMSLAHVTKESHVSNQHHLLKFNILTDPVEVYDSAGKLLSLDKDELIKCVGSAKSFRTMLVTDPVSGRLTIRCIRLSR
jgi:hypothetical protein